MPQRSIVCKLCQEEKLGAKSHVIANGFLRPILDRSGVVATVPANEPSRGSERQSGVWDSELLCRDCESRFAPIDRVGIELLRDKRGLSRRDPHENVVWVRGISGHRFRTFALFTLWRCLASGRPEFASADDPTLQEQLRQRLITEEPRSAANYPVLLIRYTGSATVRTTDGATHVIDQRLVLAGVGGPRLFLERRCYDIHLGEHALYIAVDDCPPDRLWLSRSVPNEGPIPICLHPWDRSPHYRFLRASIGAGRRSDRKV